MMVGSVPPTTVPLLKRKNLPSVGSTVICDPAAVTAPPVTVATVATVAYSESMSCTACCNDTITEVGNEGKLTTAVSPWFWLNVAFPYGIAQRSEEPAAKAIWECDV